MILLQVLQLTKYYGAELILSNIKLEIQSHDRIALVGRNGAGKSTLLKIIADQLSYDSGDIIKPKDVAIGYLAQDTGLESDLTIWNEMLSVFDPLREMEKKLRDLENQMADPSVYNNPEKLEKIVKEYDHLQIQFKEQGGYQYEADIRSVLHGLHFQDYDYETKISSLSGGQKTRLALGKLLLSKPDLLILDEPTNHLDIETLTWLEQYLQNYPGAILIVSHDRYFLDKVVTQVYEISRHKARKYYGNYSDYLIQKAEQYEREMKQYEKQQEEVEKLQDFIQRNIARASTAKRAQSRKKQLEKKEFLEKPVGEEKSAQFSFDIAKQSGNEVMRTHDLAIGYGRNAVSENIHLNITRGDSIALVGPNGVGKTTLLKTVIGLLPPIKGSVQFGTNVEIGYYDQEQANLTSNKTVLHELWDDFPDHNEKEIRTVLGNFLFSGDDVLKIVSSLSGGEKARLALAKLMMKKANFLILDEPTNHLDLDSKEVLENALIDYPGTLLFVSHDRYFINRIATKVVELSPNGTTEYLGDYDYYANKKQEQLELSLLEKQENRSPADDTTVSKNTFVLDKEAKKAERKKRRRIEEIEQTIEQKEAALSEKEALLFQPDIFQDYEKASAINQEIKQLKAEIDQLMEEWTNLQESL
ncbi:MAG: ABC-F family ATP-binding cassette domain-containing protein [Bacillales bacterium]|nr:ABC-F family ATP-binding cassette domain-containing protein [Bacillales bacterium]